MAHSYERGQKLSAKLLENGSTYQAIFELGRRMKITNPAAMRTTYGKLMWMLMDAKDSFAIRALGFDCREEEIFTVYKMLLSRDNNDATSLIKDSLLQQAVL